MESDRDRESPGWGWRIVVALLVAALLGLLIFWGVDQRRATREAEAILPGPEGVHALPPVETALSDTRDPELMSYLGALQNAMVALAESQRLQTEQLAVMGNRLGVIDEVQAATTALSTDLVALRTEMAGQIDLLREELEQLRPREPLAVDREDPEPVAPVVVETPEPVIPPVVDVEVQPETLPDAADDADVEEIAVIDEVEDSVPALVDTEPVPPAVQPSPTLMGPSSFSARPSASGGDAPAFSPVMTSLVREDRPVYSPADVRLQPVD